MRVLFFLFEILFKSVFHVIVSYCEESQISPYLQADKVALPLFHGFWQKTWDSWVTDKGLHYSWHSKRYKYHHSTVTFPCSKSHGRGQQRWAQMDVWKGSGFCYSRETLSLGNWNLFFFFLIGNYLPVLCSGGRFFLPGSEHGCPLLWRETLSLFPKCVHHKNILENRVWNKRQLVIHL